MSVDRKPEVILSVLKAHEVQLKDLKEQCLSTSHDDARVFIRTHYGSLADKFVSAGEYPLTIGDLVQFWPILWRLFPYQQKGQINNYHRRTILGIITSAHAIQGLKNPAWKKLPRCWVETDDLSEEVMGDKEGLQYVQERLQTACDSIASRDRYKGHRLITIKDDIANGIVPVLLDIKYALGKFEQM